MLKVNKVFVITLLLFIFGVFTSVFSNSNEKVGDGNTVENDMGGDKTGTASDTIQREEESIKLDGLSVAQVKEVRDKAEKFTFQAEVDRMMKLIINSLYKNKEIFLRELISNASDALDKIRFLSLTDTAAMAATDELSIRIHADKETKTLHITDTGIGMTKEDLLKNLGTIAKSGTSEFISKLTNADSSVQTNDLIGQFGVGFYSAFLVADRVSVITKNNNDEQYIWESDASSFSVTKDPRGNTLKRGTKIILHLKPETAEYLEPDALKQLVKKYSQFINFPIYLWASKTEMVDEAPAAADTPAPDAEKKDEPKKDEDATVEEEKEKEAPKTPPKQVEKTVWDWELVNENKPIWTRKPVDVKDEEYNSFYKAFSNDHQDPLAKIHFVAEGEVTFKSILFMPKAAPHDIFRSMDKSHDNIKLYVRRVFITDSFHDMMPSYLNFVKGVVDSDDLPLNVSRETLQQSKLLMVIKRKLVRKVLEMIKKLDDKDMEIFWKEFSTNVKLGVIDDNSNRTRLAKILRFWSSSSEEKMTTLGDYVKRMKETQKAIFYIAGDNHEALKKSPLVERVLKKGYEVMYMVDPIDEYAINAMPDFEGKKFQNLAKEGLDLEDNPAKAKERKESLGKTFKPLIDYLKEDALKDKVEKVEISDHLTESPCVLVATQWGNSGNMERIMRAQAYKKSDDPQTAHSLQQKKILGINPRHPLIKELNSRVSDERKTEETTRNMANVLFETAVLRSGYFIDDMAGFSSRVEHMMRLGLNVPLSEKVEEEEEDAPAAATEDDSKATPAAANEEPPKSDEQMEEDKQQHGGGSKLLFKKTLSSEDVKTEL